MLHETTTQTNSKRSAAQALRWAATTLGLLAMLVLAGCGGGEQPPPPADGRLPGEPLLRVEIVAGAPSVELVAAVDAVLEAAERSPTPEAPDVEWKHVTDVAKGATLAMEPASRVDALRLVLDGKIVSSGDDTAHLRLRPAAPQGPDAATLTLKSVPFGEGWWWSDREDRVYAGAMEFHRWRTVIPPDGYAGFGPKTDDGVQAVALVPMEAYLRGVLPREMGSSAPLEALKAQAVAARTYTMHHLGETIHPKSNIHCCSSVHCEVYGGIDRFDPRSDEAVSATCGQVVTVDGAAISAVFASCCGGWAESAGDVWPSREGIAAASRRELAAHPDAPGRPAFDLTREEELRRWVDSPPTDADAKAWCHPDRPGIPTWAHKNFRWERRYEAASLEESVAATLDGLGAIVAIEPVTRGASGRLIEVRVRGTAKSANFGPELKIRRLFQPPLPSAAVYFEPEGGDAGGPPAAWVVRGAGYGHGVGLCQTGAMAQAEAGRQVGEILEHYFPGAELVTLWGAKP